jgi:3-phenylpropionate/cinnamic acid dioxygenase small subunit
MSDETITELLDRLRRLEDEAAIRDTLYAYGSALDYGDREQFLDCFTTDADYYVSMRISGPSGMEFHGHEELGAYFDDHTHAPSAWHKHITTNPTIVPDGDTATVTSYFIRVDAGADAGPASVLASGRYHDTLVREGSEWRIRTSRCEVENL